MDTDSVILVRHSQPEIRPDIPAAQWELSEIGRQRCVPLADKIKHYQPVVVVTSRERKAIQTGTIVAHILEIPTTIAAGLHEHESAGQALLRFSAAISDVLSQHPTGSVVIVAHATVIALWVTSLIGGDPFSFWKGLGMPAYAVFSRTNLKFVEIVDHVS